MAPFSPFCSWVLYKSLNSLLKRTKHRRLASQVPPWWRVYLSMQGSVLGWGEALEKEMATHSRILAWEIPRIEEAGRLPSLGSQRWTRLGGWAHTHTQSSTRVSFPLRLTQQWFWSPSPVLAARIWQWSSQNFRIQGTLEVIQLGPDSAEEGWNLDKIVKMLKILHLVNLGIGDRKKIIKVLSNSAF